jgi:L-malate glycosyltransferase
MTLNELAPAVGDAVARAQNERHGLRPSGAPASRPSIRIAVVAPSLDILGGQAVQARALVERLRDIPWVNIGFIPINPRLPRGLRRLQRVKYLRTLVTSIRYIAELLWTLRRFDVIHVFSASYLSFVLAPTPALLIARLLRKPAILNYRSGEADDHLSRWRRTAVPTAGLARQIVVPSGYLVDVFREHGLTASAIPNFVDLERFVFRERVGLRPVFLSNRNFEAHYDVACTLRAFAEIQRRIPSAELLVAGDGPLRKELEALAAELNLRNVQFLGRVPHTLMPELHGRADVYLNTPRIDNMPVSILEAHASGLPVVTTAAGGIPYIVRDQETALLVPVGDHQAAAAAAFRLLDEPALSGRLTRAGLQECKSHYSWASVRDQWLALYSELAAESAGQTA